MRIELALLFIIMLSIIGLFVTITMLFTAIFSTDEDNDNDSVIECGQHTVYLEDYND